jgi:hypothetical protein
MCGFLLSASARRRIERNLVTTARSLLDQLISQVWEHGFQVHAQSVHILKQVRCVKNKLRECVE